jgi:SNF2 family DNA or RNA helicase
MFQVVVPLAVLTNWEREFARFCPSLRVVSIHGEDKEDRKKQLSSRLKPNSFDVVITTFDILRIEFVHFKR